MGHGSNWQWVSVTVSYSQQQIMHHTVNLRPLTKLEGGLQSLHNAGNNAVYWLEKVATWAFVKWNEQYYSLSSNTETRQATCSQWLNRSQTMLVHSTATSQSM